MFSLKNVEKTIGFTVFSLKLVEKPLVLLCFRSKMLKNHWFCHCRAPTCWKMPSFYCVFASRLPRNPYKTCQKFNFLINECKSALFFQRKIFRLYKTILQFWLYWESSVNFESAPATAGRATTLTKARFVCVSVDPSLNRNENPKK